MAHACGNSANKSCQPNNSCRKSHSCKRSRCLSQHVRPLVSSKASEKNDGSICFMIVVVIPVLRGSSYISNYISICVCIHICVRLCIYIYEYICVYIYICMYVCVCIISPFWVVYFCCLNSGQSPQKVSGRNLFGRTVNCNLSHRDSKCTRCPFCIRGKDESLRNG